MTYQKPFDRFINEYVDYTHDETRQLVLSLNESEQNKLLINLTSKLYNHITSRITDIDFGSIPNTKGDITKLENYDKLVDCIEVIRKLLLEYKQKTESIDVITEALNNIKSRKNTFEMAFKINAEFPVLIYSTVSLAIVSSVSFLISTCIEYIKVPNTDSFSIALDKVALAKTKDNLLFENLKKFNASCAKGDIDRAIDYIVKSGSKQMLGIVDTYMIMNIGVVAAIALSIIPFIRELIYFFYYSRVKTSDYFELQADLLQMNIYNLERNPNMNDSAKKDIVSKQSKIVNVFKSISNAIAISTKTSENKVQKDISDETKKMKVDNSDIHGADTALF